MIKLENLLFLHLFVGHEIPNWGRPLVWFQSFFETFKQMINHKEHMELESELAPASRVGLIV